MNPFLAISVFCTVLVIGALGVAFFCKGAAIAVGLGCLAFGTAILAQESGRIAYDCSVSIYGRSTSENKEYKISPHLIIGSATGWMSVWPKDGPIRMEIAVTNQSFKVAEGPAHSAAPTKLGVVKLQAKTMADERWGGLFLNGDFVVVALLVLFGSVGIIYVLGTVIHALCRFWQSKRPFASIYRPEMEVVEERHDAVPTKQHRDRTIIAAMVR